MELKNEKQPMIVPVCILVLIITLQQAIPMFTGNFFGSEGDWISQHVSIAESLRDAMIESKCLIPQFLQLGAGSSVYDFSYYGLLRPDVLVSCIFPTISVKYFIAGYALAGIYASGILTYFWLKKQNVQDRMALFGAILLTSSAAFYHAHHQIMFINYMPFLILALIGVDRIRTKGKSSLLIFSSFMICIHSFYYAPTCMLVIGMYSLSSLMEEHSRLGKQKGLKIALAMGIAVGMAMILLLPTALEILSGSKDGGRFTNRPLQLIWPDMKGLFYSPYSCGLTVLVLFSIIHCIVVKRKRCLAFVTLVCMSVPFVSLILNGGLYAREKILIPFIPICVLLTAQTLQKLWNQEEKYNVLVLLCCCVPGFFSEWKIIAFADFTIIAVWMFLQTSNKNILVQARKYTFVLCLVPMVSAMFLINLSDSHVKWIEKSKVKGHANGYISREDMRQEIPKAFIEQIAKANLYRTEILNSAFSNCNLTKKELQRSTMYSSVSNPLYSEFFYDTMKNAIGYNNRVALVAGENPYFNYFMGIKYLISEKDKIPLGYEKIMEEEKLALCENKEVLPMCYGTSQIMSYEDYKTLKFPDTVEALCTSVVVNTTNKSVIPKSHFQKITPELLQGALPDQIRILQFKIDRKGKKEVVIHVNNIKNKLSSRSAPYPNHNTVFTYIMDHNNNNEAISVKASKGDYKVKDVKAYIMDKTYLKHKNVVQPEQEMKKWDGKQIFYGKINMRNQGYFVTSYPWKKGYKVQVDGKMQEPEIVNTAFLGFPLESGIHQICIQFEAPGYRVGKIITIIAVLLWGIIFFVENRSREENLNEKQK